MKAIFGGKLVDIELSQKAKEELEQLKSDLGLPSWASNIRCVADKETVAKMIDDMHKYRNELVLVEKLAELEHDQWMEWAKSLLQSELLTYDRQKRWSELFIPYDQLSNEMKEHDRKWARKVVEIMKEHKMLEML